ncbi:hypothetical protein BHM03_00000210 [Ensete ventricosum]|nr:hypothetical protein BHM03_00000210 [Ensete ventricosum]
MIFSMRHIMRISRQIEKLQFCAIPEQHVHVEQVDNEMVTNYPDSPNSYRLRCPIPRCSHDVVIEQDSKLALDTAAGYKVPCNPII